MFSVLLILLTALGFGLALFLLVLLFLNPKKFQNVVKDPTVVIVKIVEQHRENLPVDSAHGWILTPSNCSLRCWQKEILFTSIGSPLLVYACTKELPCAAVILLNVIADVSTWPEWDVEAQDQTLHLELPENSSLHGDPFMQCDQVLTTSKLNTKPEVEIFRFGNLESNGTGWILLWNAKRLDWILYIAQPIDDSDDCDPTQSKERCLLTAIWGCDPKPASDPSPTLCRKVLHLASAIAESQRHPRPFRPLLRSASPRPHFPTIRSALIDLPRSPCDLLLRPKDRAPAAFQNAALALVAQAPTPHQPLVLGNIAGFSLVLCQLKKGGGAAGNGSVGGAANGDVTPGERRSRRRQKVRSDSMHMGFPKNKGKQPIVPHIVSAQLDLENRRSSSLSAPLRKKPPELTITQPEEEPAPQRASSHSFLHSLFQRRHSSESCQRSRSPSPSQNLKRRLFGSSRKESSSQEDLIGGEETESRFLRMVGREEGENSDFKALGEYSISAVLQENLKASMVDVNATEEEQKRISGGWVYKETNKNIAIFKKTTTFDSCMFMSYLCKGIIPTSLSIVWKTLCNPLTRFMYDDTVKKITVLHEYPEGQKLIHMYNESVTLLHKEVQDFCILQTEKVEGSQFMLGFHSVKDIICPPVKDIVRGTVVASGWVVEPVNDDTVACQVSYLVQMVVSSPEASTTMEEISNLQSQCINNLSLYLSAKPPSYLPVRH